jgi:hypothetical protein
LTAGAATALATVPDAEAEIHYSGIVDYHFPGTQLTSAYFPLNSGANLFFQQAPLGQEGLARLEIVGPSGRAGDSVGAIVGSFVHYGGFYISNLGKREYVSQNDFGAYCKFTSTGSGSELRCFGGTIGYTNRSNGKFREPGRGFIGFSFDTGAGPQYGWARIKTNGEPEYHFILVDYAWADPGESLQTGQKRSTNQADAVPISGSLGLLAVGGAGLITWRNRRSRSKAKGS